MADAWGCVAWGHIDRGLSNLLSEAAPDPRRSWAGREGQSLPQLGMGTGPTAKHASKNLEKLQRF